MIEVVLSENRAVVWDREKANELFEELYVGKPREDRLELALIEAAYLLDVGKITVVDKTGKAVGKEEMFQYCSQKDPRFSFRYAVYKDLKNKELPTRTGFKFGCDFRVYNKGVKPLKRGPKSAGEHTKWIVFAVPENYVFSFPELSRAVRLAHNIRANMLWAVVYKDSVGYYAVKFFKP